MQRGSKHCMHVCVTNDECMRNEMSRAGYGAKRRQADGRRAGNQMSQLFSPWPCLRLRPGANLSVPAPSRGTTSLLPSPLPA